MGELFVFFVTRKPRLIPEGKKYIWLINIWKEGINIPFVSTSQMRWMFKNHSKMAEEWAAHTPDIKHLPKKVKKGKSGSYDQKTVSMAMKMRKK